MKKVLITSGGTKIAIDKVRHIGNMSQGTFGSKIAKSFLHNRFKVDFLKAVGSKSPFSLSLDFHKGDNPNIFNEYQEYLKYRDFYNQYEYKSFDDYAAQLKKLVIQNKPDVIILAAAVSDYGVKNYVDGKIRSKENELNINLFKLPKLIESVASWTPKSTYIVGFKLLVDSTINDLKIACLESLVKNDLNLIVGNDLRDIKENNHKLTVYKTSGECYKLLSAPELVDTIIKDLK